MGFLRECFTSCERRSRARTDYDTLRYSPTRSILNSGQFFKSINYVFKQLFLIYLEQIIADQRNRGKILHFSIRIRSLLLHSHESETLC